LPQIQHTQLELDRLRVTEQLRVSLRRETEAEAKVRSGDLAAAETLWREAWELQRDVNRAVGEKMRNLEREMRLEQEVTRLTAEPLAAQVQQLMGQGATALKAGKWTDALVMFRRARDLQDRLNREFPRSRYSDLSIIARIDAELAVLSADGLDLAVNQQWENARQLVLLSREAEAAAALADAAEAQRALNDRFRGSRFMSMERLEQIEAERQTVLAAAPWRAVVELQLRARGHLQRRQLFQAQQLVGEAVGKMGEVASRWPKARNLDEELRMQLSFLDVRAAELGTMQDRIYDQLAPLPGAATSALLRGEVNQADYARMMNANPSRNTGRVLSVDSVTLAEAEEFCRRLSWVLGLPVRLPSAAELQTAGNDANEFKDLAGGLEEWLARESAKAETAPVLSADGQSVAPVALTDRSRTRGFRVVVEVDLAHLPGMN
ncbi:MAG: hypothetical protein Q8J74_14840, partial [Candidatus Didemnitutus sp.]|nr:hypothetical protein [Candidatus Didemnitutus sp.]